MNFRQNVSGLPPGGFRFPASDQIQRQRFQAFHRVAICAPEVVAGKHIGFRASPWIAQDTIQRVEAVEAQIGGQRAYQGGIRALSVAARQPGQRHQHSIAQIGLWAFAEHMQPIADLHFFQLAQIIIQLGERFVRRFIGIDAAIEIKTG